MQDRSPVIVTVPEALMFPEIVTVPVVKVSPVIATFPVIVVVPVIETPVATMETVSSVATIATWLLNVVVPETSKLPPSVTV